MQPPPWCSDGGGVDACYIGHWEFYAQVGHTGRPPARRVFAEEGGWGGGAFTALSSHACSSPPQRPRPRPRPRRKRNASPTAPHPMRPACAMCLGLPTEHWDAEHPTAALHGTDRPTREEHFRPEAEHQTTGNVAIHRQLRVHDVLVPTSSQEQCCGCSRSLQTTPPRQCRC